MKNFTVLKTMAAGALLITAQAYAQPSFNAAKVPATDGRDVQIFPSKHPQSEVSIIINKKNPQNFIASCNTYGAGPTHYYNQGYYSTHDGGKTWTGSDYLNNVTDFRNYNYDASPSLAFTTDTVAVMTTQDGAWSYWFQKSYNGGISFSNQIAADSNDIYAKNPRIAIDDAPSSRYKNYFYAAWRDGYHGGIGFDRSTDTGHTFSSEIIVRPTSGQGPSVQTGVNGEVYVCWADAGVPATGCGFAKSLDGGATFTPYKIAFPYAGIATSNTDFTFNFTITVDYPSMAVDKSNGAHRGRIYIAYPSKETGKAVIYVRYSDDKGTTWSSGKAVSIPDAGQSFLPSVTVDDVTGNVYVDYFAFDNPNVSYSTNTYVAGSSNGTTWKNLKVSDAPHITHDISGYARPEGYYGYYIGIAAYNNKVYPAWMDDRTGTFQIYMSKETVAATAFTTAESAQSIAAAPVEKMLVSPNPFGNTLHLLLPIENIQMVELYNQSGKLIKQWKNASSGTLNVGDVLQGIYVLHITDKQNNLYTQKLVKE